jgi:hypothetical protein
LAHFARIAHDERGDVRVLLDGELEVFLLDGPAEDGRRVAHELYQVEDLVRDFKFSCFDFAVKGVSREGEGG